MREASSGDLGQLIVHVDLDDRQSVGGDVSFRAWLFIERGDGERLTVLDDRGWSGNYVEAELTPAEIERTALAAVGPDEPFDDRTAKDMESDYWEYIAERCAVEGLVIDAQRLSGFPRRVEFSARVDALLSRAVAPASEPDIAE